MGKCNQEVYNIRCDGECISDGEYCGDGVVRAGAWSGGIILYVIFLWCGGDVQVEQWVYTVGGVVEY